MTVLPITTNTHRCWPLPAALLVDNDELDADRRERACQRRLAAHPDPRDPDHPEPVEP